MNAPCSHLQDRDTTALGGSEKRVADWVFTVYSAALDVAELLHTLRSTHHPTDPKRHEEPLAKTKQPRNKPLKIIIYIQFLKVFSRR